MGWASRGSGLMEVTDTRIGGWNSVTSAATEAAVAWERQRRDRRSGDRRRSNLRIHYLHHTMLSPSSGPDPLDTARTQHLLPRAPSQETEQATKEQAQDQ